MLLKLFRCEVSPDQREAFAEGQRVWRVCANLDGFGAQGGGWDQQRAWIAAWWQNWESYQKFMLEDHDRLFKRGEQQSLYTQASSSFWTALDSEYVDRRDSSDGAAPAQSMQLEWMELAPGSQPDFRDFLAWRWRPGLAGTAGLLQARVLRHRKRPGFYLAWSTWSRGAVHRSVASWLQPGFRLPQSRYRVLRSHEICNVNLVPDWQVPLPDTEPSSHATQQQSEEPS